MKRLAVFALAIIAAALFAACSFNNVKMVEISFYDGNTLLEKISLHKFKNDGIAEPKREGSEFDGWYLDAECTQRADFNAIQSNCNVYAGWKTQTETHYYNVIFMSDENTFLKTTRASSVSSIEYPEPPSKQGYTFTGWSGVPDKLTQDVTIVAQYKRICKINFYTDDTYTELYASKTILEGETVELPPTPAKADTVGVYYMFKGWSADLSNVHTDVRVYAVFEPHNYYYEYTFLNENGSILAKGSGTYLSQYETPVATKATDANYVYIFQGYDLNNDGVVDELPAFLTGNFTARAVFKAMPRTFTVEFYNGEELVATVEAEYGGSASTDVIPTKASDEEFDYIFNGWDNELTNILSDIKTYATYTSTKRSYTYVFYSYDGQTVLKRETALYGETILPPTPDEKASDEENHYVFAGWSGYEENMILTADISFTETFTPVKRTYTYKFIFNNEVYAGGELEYGEVIPKPQDPAREGYVFKGWSGYQEGVTISGNCEFNARFSKIE